VDTIPANVALRDAELVRSITRSPYFVGKLLS
jgi:hypothetical protein